MNKILISIVVLTFVYSGIPVYASIPADYIKTSSLHDCCAGQKPVQTVSVAMEHPPRLHLAEISGRFGDEATGTASGVSDCHKARVKQAATDINSSCNDCDRHQSCPSCNGIGATAFIAGPAPDSRIQLMTSIVVIHPEYLFRTLPVVPEIRPPII